MPPELIKWTAVLVLVGIAAVLAYRKTDGWGWFLLIAFVLAPVTTH